MHPFRPLIRSAPLLFTLLLWTVPSPAPAALPTIQGSPATAVSAGGSYQFLPSASDPDGDPLRFTIWNKPAWANFDPATGRLGGNPTAADVGTTYGVVVAVNDGSASSSLEPFDLTVQGGSVVNEGPSISGSPALFITEEEAYRFQPSAQDPDRDNLTFSIDGRPMWASFDALTGVLSGTPPRGVAGNYRGILIGVSDGKVSRYLPAFTLTVQTSSGGNRPPSIHGTPATAIPADASYQFQPSASDPDGDPLRFTIWNKPAWASFDPYTGRLSGNPTAADVGTTYGIVVAVNDGHVSTSLSPFNFTVEGGPSAAGVAVITWTAPTRNTDGSWLTNLAGYRLYYGLSPSTLTRAHEFGSPDTTIVRYENLRPGTHYFAISAYNQDGVESPLSEIGSKTIP